LNLFVGALVNKVKRSTQNDVLLILLQGHNRANNYIIAEKMAFFNLLCVIMVI